MKRFLQGRRTKSSEFGLRNDQQMVEAMEPRKEGIFPTVARS